jgi:hypothetical protein
MGNTIVPLDEMNISMEAETVSVVPMMGGDVARCKFIMKSHSDSTIKALVGFPINRPPWYPHFTVSVNGKDVPTAKNLIGSYSKNPMEHVLYYESDHEGLDYPGFYTWMVEWKPYETVVIEVEYIAGIPGRIDGIVRGHRFEYIVRTGGFWRGLIGNAVISAELAWNLIQWFDYVQAEEVAERISYPENATKELVDRKNVLITWEFEDWEPEEEIVFEIYGWVGVDGIYETYLLPKNYVGDTQLYDENYIDQLTEVEFSKAREYYPERVDTTNREPYRHAIANILKNEILARNGYSFHAQNFPEDKMAKYFMRYRKLDWFDYKSTLSLFDAKDKFNEYERRNFEFLTKYMESIKPK